MKKTIRLLVLIPTLAFAGPVEWDTASADLGYHWAYDATLGYSTWVPTCTLSARSYLFRPPDPLPWTAMSIAFGIAKKSPTSITIAEVISFQLDPTWVLHQMEYGDWVDSSLTAPGFDASLYNAGDCGGELTIGVGETVYLGYVVWRSAIWGKGMPDYYGWMELMYDGDDIRVVNSALDIGGDFIQIRYRDGPAVPEPSTALLALSGVALLLRRRRQRERASR